MVGYNNFLITLENNLEESRAYRSPMEREEILIKTNNSCLSATVGSNYCFECKNIQSDEWYLCLIGNLNPDQDIQLNNFLIDLDPNCLNGNFLLFGWNRFLHQWHVWTNRMGTIHSYYAINNNRFAIGTSFHSVANIASNKKIDWLGLAEFFQFGFFSEDTTFFEDIKIFNPASHYIFDDQGKLIQNKRYWEWKHSPEGSGTYEESATEFACIFDEVMENMISQGRIAVPISGGLDSRSTVASIFSTQQEKSRFWSYSYGYSSDSIETRISSQIAKARDLRFSSFTIQPYLFDHLEKVTSAVEGFQDITQCRQAFIQDDLRKNSDKLIAAHWGDVWLDTMGLDNEKSDLSKDEFNEYAWKKLCKRGGNELVNKVCNQQLYGNSTEQLKDVLKQKAITLDSIQDPDFRFKSLKTDWWSFRWTLASIRMFQNASWPCLPFYDNRIVDFFCRTPSNCVKGRKMQIDYIKRKAPDLAKIIWQPYEANLYNYDKPDLLRLPKRVARKAWRAGTGNKVIQRNWEIQFLNPRGKAGLEQWLLKPGLRIHDFVSVQWLSNQIKILFLHPDAAIGYQVSMLLTFSAWLEMYG